MVQRLVAGLANDTLQGLDLSADGSLLPAFTLNLPGLPTELIAVDGHPSLLLAVCFWGPTVLVDAAKGRVWPMACPPGVVRAVSPAMDCLVLVTGAGSLYFARLLL